MGFLWVLCEYVDTWLHALDGCLIQIVFPTHAYCSWDRLQIHRDPEQDKVLTDEKWTDYLNSFCVFAGVLKK